MMEGVEKKQSGLFGRILKFLLFFVGIVLGLCLFALWFLVKDTSGTWVILVLAIAAFVLGIVNQDGLELLMTDKQKRAWRDRRQREKQKVEEQQEEAKKKREDKKTISARVRAEKLLQTDAKAKYLENFKARSGKAPIEITILGGLGWESKAGTASLLSFDKTNVYVGNPTSLTDDVISMEQFRNIEISGPGKVSSDAGVMGGGFGLEGALKGAAAAAVINLLTSSSTTKTFIRVEFESSELVAITSQMEPQQARLYFSGLFVEVNSLRHAPSNNPSLADELVKLMDLRNSGLLSEEELLLAKKKLLGNK